MQWPQSSSIREQHHLDFFPTVVCVRRPLPLPTRVIPDLLPTIDSRLRLSMKPRQAGEGALVKPPAAGVRSSAMSRPIILILVPGQRWGNCLILCFDFLFWFYVLILCFASYLVLNFIPLLYPIEFPRVERASLNPFSVSLYPSAPGPTCINVSSL